MNERDMDGYFLDEIRSDAVEVVGLIEAESGREWPIQGHAVAAAPDTGAKRWIL